MNFQSKQDKAIIDALHSAVAPEDYRKTQTAYEWNPAMVKSIEDLLSTSQGIELLLRDKYYQGLGDKIYPSVLDDILELYEERKKRDVNLCVFVEGIGAGKTVKAGLITWLQWLQLSCKGNGDPREYYQLAPGSKIAFSIMNRTEKLAQKVTLNKMISRWECPFNRDYFPRDENYKNEIVIRKNDTGVFAGTGSALAAIGWDLFGGCMDEANFLEVVEDSRKAAISTNYDAAEDMHNAIFDRITSRFMFQGKIDGMLLMFSSPRYPDDFLERKIKESEVLGERSVLFTRRRSMWKAKGLDKFPSGKFFYVDVDTLAEVEAERGEAFLELKTYIAEFRRDCFSIQQAYNEDARPLMLKAPYELYKNFLRDPENFVRNMGCVPLNSIRPFFRRKKEIERVIDYNRQNPLLEEKPYTFDKDYKPINLEKGRYLHLDLAYSQDMLGIACVHCTGFQERVKSEGAKSTVIQVPNIYVDFVGRIEAPKGEEIILDDVIQIIFDIRSRFNMKLRLVTFDRFQSIGYIQNLRKYGIRAANLSIDKTANKIVLSRGTKSDSKKIKKEGFEKVSTNGNYIAAMQCLKDAIYNGRIDMVYHPWFAKEARGAEYNEVSVKVDHTPHTTLDMLQALAGACYNLENNEHYVDTEKRDAQLRAMSDPFYQGRNFQNESALANQGEISQTQQDINQRTKDYGF